MGFMRRIGTIVPTTTLPFGLAVALAGVLGIVHRAAAQDVGTVRAIPAAVEPPPDFERALNRGWRSEDGSPGHAYWQQWVGYDLTAKLDPETAKLEGTVRILFAHDAPTNFTSVWVHLHQNLHKEGSPRYEAQEITGGRTTQTQLPSSVPYVMSIEPPPTPNILTGTSTTKP